MKRAERWRNARLRGLWIAIGGLIAGLAMASAAAAQEWVIISDIRGSARFEIDIRSVVADGAVVRSWSRETPSRPDRLPNGQRYAYRIVERLDDCEAKRFRYSKAGFYSATGSVVQPFADMDVDWTPVGANTVAEALWQAGCGVAAGEQTADIHEGEWRKVADVAGSGGADTGSAMYARMDAVVAAGEYRVIMTRSDYRAYQAYEGIPFRYTLNVAVVDCKARSMGLTEAQFYATPTLLIAEVSTPQDKLVLAPARPGAVSAQVLDLVCAAPTITADQLNGEQPAQAPAVATAWATSKGYLVTAAHALADDGPIEVYQNGERLGVATIAAADPANDLAILKFVPGAGRRLRIIPLADKPATVGRNVFVLGYAAADPAGQRARMSSGEVSAATGPKADARFLQISIPPQPGADGAPLLAFDGTALGVVAQPVTAKAGVDAAPSAANYAVKVAYLRALLEELPDLKNYDAPAAAVNADDLIAQARVAVFMLVVGAPERK